MPILPGRFLEYVGSDGEIHIKDDNDWADCPGLYLLELFHTVLIRSQATITRRLGVQWQM